MRSELPVQHRLQSPNRIRAASPSDARTTWATDLKVPTAPVPTAPVADLCLSSVSRQRCSPVDWWLQAAGSQQPRSPAQTTSPILHELVVQETLGAEGGSDQERALSPRVAERLPPTAQPSRLPRRQAARSATGGGAGGERGKGDAAAPSPSLPTPTPELSSTGVLPSLGASLRAQALDRGWNLGRAAAADSTRDP